MKALTTHGGRVLQAAILCPDTALLQEFKKAADAVDELALVTELEEYPPPQSLLDGLKRGQPDAVLIDVGSSRDQAIDLISFLSDHCPQLSTAGLCSSNDAEAVLQCLRNGAAEFLWAPFSHSELSKAVDRMLRRKAVEAPPEVPDLGRILAFAPAKGGSGCTTIAYNTALRLHRERSEPVLLADFDLAEGIVSFLLRLKHRYSIMDAAQHSSQLDRTLWDSLVSETSGVDVLCAPERPTAASVESYSVQEVLEYARTRYKYIVLDLPGVCGPLALASLPMATDIFLVGGSDMAGLFLMRRTIQLLEEMGYNREQIHVLINRLDKGADITLEDMQTIFRCAVAHTFPSDAAGVDRAMREGVAVADNSPLGKRIMRFVKSCCRDDPSQSAKPADVGALRELLSGA